MGHRHGRRRDRRALLIPRPSPSPRRRGLADHLADVPAGRGTQGRVRVLEDPVGLLARRLVGPDRRGQLSVRGRKVPKSRDGQRPDQLLGALQRGALQRGALQRGALQRGAVLRQRPVVDVTASYAVARVARARHRWVSSRACYGPSGRQRSTSARSSCGHQLACHPHAVTRRQPGRRAQRAETRARGGCVAVGRAPAFPPATADEIAIVPSPDPAHRRGHNRSARGPRPAGSGTSR